MRVGQTGPPTPFQRGRAPYWQRRFSRRLTTPPPEGAYDAASNLRCARITVFADHGLPVGVATPRLFISAAIALAATGDRLLANLRTR